MAETIASLRPCTRVRRALTSGASSRPGPRLAFPHGYRTEMSGCSTNLAGITNPLGQLLTRTRVAHLARAYTGPALEGARERRRFAEADEIGCLVHRHTLAAQIVNRKLVTQFVQHLLEAGAF